MDETRKNSNFILNIIDKDIEEKKYKPEEIITRFPPEPNGYLHIGHVKAALLNYNIAKLFGGKFNLRFDDTNPSKEDKDYVDSIISDLDWLGVSPSDKPYYGSSYFPQMIEYAKELINKGLAYVDDQSTEEIRENRGTLKEPGKESPYRDRTPEENRQLFEKMIEGEFKPGEKVLRAKIDMASPNMNLRDPVIYRILDMKHHHTKENYHIYPMYDYAHPLEDAIEGVTHSLCTLEFEDHRPLYDWVLANIDDFKEKPPVQIEFAKLDLNNTIIGKRFIKQLVDEGIVDGWDDPRLATISGLRRRGYTPEALQKFCEEIGISKSNSTVDKQMLEHFVRDDLKDKTKRLNVVLNPLKVEITNYPEGQTELLEIETNMDNPEMGKHKMPFSKNIYIEKSDFMLEPPKKFFRLFPGNEVRLRGAYFVKCTDVIQDENGEVIEIKCTYDPETKSGSGFKGRKVKGTIHWVDANEAIPIKVNLLDDLIKDDTFDSENFLNSINKNSKITVTALAEPEIKTVKPDEKVQFIRNGYFNYDSKESQENEPVFNRIVELKSGWRPPKKEK